MRRKEARTPRQDRSNRRRGHPRARGKARNVDLGVFGTEDVPAGANISRHFSVNAPYCFCLLECGRWLPLNRFYRPLGTSEVMFRCARSGAHFTMILSRRSLQRLRRHRSRMPADGGQEPRRRVGRGRRQAGRLADPIPATSRRRGPGPRAASRGALPTGHPNQFLERRDRPADEEFRLAEVLRERIER
jgi:hypothetical protein